MARKIGFKREKLKEKILNDLNIFMRQDISDPRLKLVTFTKVDLTSDFAYAKVFWDSFDFQRKDEIQGGIDSVRNKLRGLLGQTLKLRHIPHLSFIYDSQFDAENHITTILNDEDKRVSWKDA